jgi:hypothetical protein
MCQSEFSLHYCLGKGLQEGKVVGRKLLPIPEVCLSGIHIEIAQVQFAECGPVVVPCHAEVRLRPEEVDTGIWVGAIAHDVSQAPDPIDRTGIVQDCLEGFEIAMDVREYQVAHALSRKDSRVAAGFPDAVLRPSAGCAACQGSSHSAEPSCSSQGIPSAALERASKWCS